MNSYEQPKSDQFDDLLAKSVAEQNEIMRRARIMDDCDNALDRYQVPTVFRFDETRRYEQSVIFDRDPNKVRRDSVFVTRAASLIDQYQRDGDLGRATDSKKKLMAELHVRYGTVESKEWLVFMGDMVPGEPLDFDDVEDIHYVADAQANRDKASMRLEKLHETLGVCILRLLGSDSNDPAMQQRYNVVATACMQVPFLDEYQRAATIDGIARDHDVPREHVEQIAESLEEFRRLAQQG